MTFYGEAKPTINTSSESWGLKVSFNTLARLLRLVAEVTNCKERKIIGKIFGFINLCGRYYHQTQYFLSELFLSYLRTSNTDRFIQNIENNAHFIDTFSNFSMLFSLTQTDFNHATLAEHHTILNNLVNLWFLLTFLSQWYH